MPQIFISYSRKDIGFVRKLAGDLENAGYDVWWDLTDLRGGDDWPRVIPAAIEASQFVIVVLSPNSAISDWVEKEYTQALGLRKKIIPIMLTTSRVPFALNTINYVDFRSDDYAANLNNLLNALGYTGERPVVPSPTLPRLLRRYAVPILIGVLFLLALLSTMVTLSPTFTLTVTQSPTLTASPTNRPFSRLGLCVVSENLNWGAINVRSGPGTIYAPLGEALPVGTCLFFSARNEEATWLQIA